MSWKTNNSITRYIIIYFFLLLVGLFCCQQNEVAAADGGYGHVWINPNSGSSSGGGGGGGGDCDGGYETWLSDCTGASWIYYKAVNKMNQSAIKFGAPYASLANDTGVSVDIPSECQGSNLEGGFWHYGYNGSGHKGGTFFYEGFSRNKNRYYIEPGAWGHWQTVGYGVYTWLQGKRDTFSESELGHQIIDDSIFDSSKNVVFESIKSATAQEVAKDFYRACMLADNVENKGDCGTESNPFIPTGTYMFCFWGTFRGSSKVTATGPNGSDMAETGIVAKDSKTVADENAEISVKVGESATLDFRHNVYAFDPASSIWWRVYRDNGLVNGGSGYTIISKNYGDETTTPNKKEEFKGGNKEGIYYVSNNNGYVLNDAVTIEFSEDGIYTFCETLDMATEENAWKDGTFTSKVCVTIEVYSEEVLPPPEEINPCEDGVSWVWSKVRNGRLTGAYSGWWGEINYSPEMDGKNVTYAKPTDTIEWVNQYCAGAQSNGKKNVVFINGEDDGRHGKHIDENTSNKKTTMCKTAKWDNKFRVVTTSPSGLGNPSIKIYDGKLDCGDAVLKEVDNEHIVVGKDDVGKTYDDLISMVGNTPITSSFSEEKHEWNAWTECEDPETLSYHPCQRKFKHPDNPVGYGKFKIPDSPTESRSFVRIPYNYINTASFRIITPSPVYPGETVNVTASKVKVGKRKNDVVEGPSYATKVGDAEHPAKVKLIAYVSTGNQQGEKTVASVGEDLCNGAYINFINTGVPKYELCKEVKKTEGILNSEGLLAGKVYTNNILDTYFDGTYEVFDAKAGDWFCMTLGVYPSTSGLDRNLDARGDNEWYLYTPSCIQIAKKPSFQVWGGGLYTAGSVKTNISKKKNIYKLFEYNSSSTTIFGSWVEENITALGSVTWLASGAGLGRNGGGSVGGYSGDGANIFCDEMTSLSFANYGLVGGFCPHVDSSGGAGIRGTNSSFDTAANVSVMAEYWNSGEEYSGDLVIDDLNVVDSDLWTSVVSGTGKNIQVLNVDGVVNMYSSSIDKNQTRVVKAKTAIINGNISYVDYGYTSHNDIPKVVIYASNNIYIDCTVERIDAILIARGTVDTCYNGGNLESRERSYQLLVGGTIISNRLILGRTYGNSFGVGHVLKTEGGVSGSFTPAEIINYDTSILLWGSSMAGSAESNTLTVTYMHELAPRY